VTSTDSNMMYNVVDLNMDNYSAKSSCDIDLRV